jgi:hypothetical protein
MWGMKAERKPIDGRVKTKCRSRVLAGRDPDSCLNVARAGDRGEGLCSDEVGAIERDREQIWPGLKQIGH